MMEINSVPSYAPLNIMFASIQLEASSSIPVAIMHH